MTMEEKVTSVLDDIYYNFHTYKIVEIINLNEDFIRAILDYLYDFDSCLVRDELFENDNFRELIVEKMVNTLNKNY